MHCSQAAGPPVHPEQDVVEVLEGSRHLAQVPARPKGRQVNPQSISRGVNVTSCGVTVSAWHFRVCIIAQKCRELFQLKDSFHLQLGLECKGLLAGHSALIIVLLVVEGPVDLIGGACSREKLVLEQLSIAQVGISQNGKPAPRLCMAPQ